MKIARPLAAILLWATLAAGGAAQDSGAPAPDAPAPGQEPAPAILTTTPGASDIPTADLSVTASVPGAQIYVEGQPKGEAPLVIKGLLSGFILRVEARAGGLGGYEDILLEPGELRELSIAMVPMKGNLLILGGGATMRLRIDGEDRGSLGSGLVRDLAVGKHELELESSSAVWSASVEVRPEATTRIEAKPRPIGRIEVSAPAEATIEIVAPAGLGPNLGAGPTTIAGGGSYERVDAGTYELVANAPGYVESRSRVSVSQGATARWTPWTVGYIEFADAPAGATFRLDGPDTTPAPAVGTIGGLAPGAARFLLSAPGFFDRTIDVEVPAGRPVRVSAAMERQVPGRVTIVGLPLEAGLRVNGRLVSLSRKSASEPAVASDLPVRIPLRLEIVDPRSAGLDPQFAVHSITLDNGGSGSIEVKTGTLFVPFAPKGSRLRLGAGSGGREILAATGGPAKDFAYSGLLPGSYPVSLEGPYKFSGAVQIQAQARSEPLGYREAIAAALSKEKDALGEKLKGLGSWKAAGWAAAAVGTIGGIGVGAAFYLGAQAMQDYRGARSSADALEARDRAESLAAVLWGSAAATALGAGSAPLFFSKGTDRSGVAQAVQSLDQQIRQIQGQDKGR